MSVATAVQFLKGYSAYVVFKEMPNHRLRYHRGHFWSEGYSNGSVGPQNEETIQTTSETRTNIDRRGCLLKRGEYPEFSRGGVIF